MTASLQSTASSPDVLPDDLPPADLSDNARIVLARRYLKKDERGRPVEEPGSRPLRFEGNDEVGARLIEWPAQHTIKCLAFYRPDDDQALKLEQIRKLQGLQDAARRLNRELLIEVIAGRHGSLAEDTVVRALEELYAAGLTPDWWKLEPQKSKAAWRNIARAVEAPTDHSRR